MSRTKTALPAREKNVLDIPLYRSGDSAHNPHLAGRTFHSQMVIEAVFTQASSIPRLEMKPVFQLKRQFTRICKMRPAERVAVVEHVVVVADIQRAEA